MDGPWSHYAKWNKSNGERQIVYDLTYLWNLIKKNKNAKLVEKEIRYVITRGKLGSGLEEGGQKVQTSSYKMNKYQGYMHDDYS